MKYAITFAVAALLNNVSGIKNDDLFTDDGENAETLKSLNQAEKIHNSKFKGLSVEDQRDLISEKSAMKFTNDEFIKNDKKTFA